MMYNGRREVELHIHLDESWRPETVFRFAKKKRIAMPCSTAGDFAKHMVVKTPNSLGSVLKTFDYLFSPIQGDKEALDQVTRDFVEDCVVKGGLCYVETRFCPHFFTGDKLSVEEATDTVLKSMEKSAHQHGLKWKAILCMMRNKPEWSDEIVDLAFKFRKQNVVAVDLAGDDKPCDGKNTDARTKAAFKKAHEAGLHCIAHAGENGCAASVTEAVHEMYAERIGHGYHILDDYEVYQDMKERNIHFEVCPLSSMLSGSVLGDWADHPIATFEKDYINYSISTDDPTLTGQWMLAEKRMLLDSGLLDAERFIAASIRAAEASFLEYEEKMPLIRYLEEGISGLSF